MAESTRMWEVRMWSNERLCDVYTVKGHIADVARNADDRKGLYEGRVQTEIWLQIP